MNIYYEFDDFDLSETCEEYYNEDNLELNCDLSPEKVKEIDELFKGVVHH